MTSDDFICDAIPIEIARAGPKAVAPFSDKSKIFSLQSSLDSKIDLHFYIL